jgi:hypothetical protein
MKQKVWGAALALALVTALALAGCSNDSTNLGSELSITGISGEWGVMAFSGTLAAAQTAFGEGNEAAFKVGAIGAGSTTVVWDSEPAAGAYVIILMNDDGSVTKYKADVAIPGSVAFSSFTDMDG